MSLRTLARLLVTYVTVLFIASGWVVRRVRLSPVEGPIVESGWKNGTLVSRRVVPPNEMDTTAAGEQVKRVDPELVLVRERVVGTGPLFRFPWLFELGLVAGRDGVVAELDGKTEYATVDDLLALQAYDRGGALADPSLGFGTHRAVVFHWLATRFRSSAQEVERRAELRRARFVRVETRRVATGDGGERPVKLSAQTLTRARVGRALHEAAHYLARNLDAEGRFRYLVVAPTNVSVPTYNWPRHSGATFFLAQAAALLDDPELRFASLRAAARLRDDTMQDCGEQKCVADGDLADVGSSALALIAFTEIVRTGADGSYRPAIVALAQFLRSMQRADGELMHLYSRSTQSPLDLQFLYFTGEAALALARAHTVTADPRDLEASKRALAHLVGPGWDFFGSRYYWTEEHWTCQATEELWDRAPSYDALRFCLEWHRFQRRLQQDEGDSPFDGEGSFGVGPLVSPRVTPAASRGEAAGATLAVLRRAVHGTSALAGEAPLLERELNRALAFVLRHQLLDETAPNHLFADPEAVRGALPGSNVDLMLRIDYAQHAGSAMIRWLELHPPSEEGGTSGTTSRDRGG